MVVSRLCYGLLSLLLYFLSLQLPNTFGAGNVISRHLQSTVLIAIQEVKPTFFFAVPRVWEKMMEKMVQVSTRSMTFVHSSPRTTHPSHSLLTTHPSLQVGRESTGIKKVISTWAKSKGESGGLCG